MVNKILSACRDADGKKLPDGVEIHNINQVKMNSYSNTGRNSVTMDLDFKGVKSLPNAKYYSIVNLTVEKYMHLYDAIFAELDNDTDELFPFWDTVEDEEEVIE